MIVSNLASLKHTLSSKLPMAGVAASRPLFNPVLRSAYLIKSPYSITSIQSLQLRAFSGSPPPAPLTAPQADATSNHAAETNNSEATCPLGSPTSNSTQNQNPS